MGDPAPNIKQFPVDAATGNAYAVQWIKQAINTDGLQPPDAKRLNGDSRVNEAVESIRIAYEAGGKMQARAIWREVVSKAVPELAQQVNRRQRLFHIDELKKRPPIKWLVEGEIPEGGLTLMYGPSGAGKSFLAVDYAAKISMQHPIVYIAGEGESGYGKRHEAWCQEFGCKSGQFYVFEDAVNFLDMNQVEAFIIEVQHLKPKMIVIDTLARCAVGGDENSQKDMGVFVDHCRTVQRELETAVLVIHHTGKSANGPRGSSALAGAADVMIEISNEDGNVQISCEKSKDSKPFANRWVRMKEITLEDGQSSLVVLPWDQVKRPPQELQGNQREIVKWLASDYFDRGARANDLKRATGIADRSFYRAVTSLARRGIVEKEGKYDPWILTPYGRQVAAFNGLKVADDDD